LCWTFTATRVPSSSQASWTWAIDAELIGFSLNSGQHGRTREDLFELLPGRLLDGFSDLFEVAGRRILVHVSEGLDVGIGNQQVKLRDPPLLTQSTVQA
jgi:hypothetical protein